MNRIKSMEFISYNYKNQVHHDEPDMRRGKVKVVFEDGKRKTIKQVLRKDFYSGNFNV